MVECRYEYAVAWQPALLVFCLKLELLLVSECMAHAMGFWMIRMKSVWFEKKMGSKLILLILSKS